MITKIPKFRFASEVETKIKYGNKKGEPFLSKYYLIIENKRLFAVWQSEGKQLLNYYSFDEIQQEIQNHRWLPLLEDPGW